MYKILIACCLLLTNIEITAAQRPGAAPGNRSQPFILGETVSISSSMLQEKRILNIYLPEAYGLDSTRLFPVIYLLDGSANEDFVHTCGLVQFLTMTGIMPPTIVVGIVNVDRRRDFTFPTTITKDKTDYPTTGGSGKFIDFIALELQPYIKQHYRTNHMNTIIGQSLGGLVVTEMLFHNPGLFSNYIIVSPSLWWDNESLLQQAPNMKRYTSSDSLQVFITVGKEGKEMENDAAALAAAIKKYGPATIKYQHRPLPEEDHRTILHQALYAALVWLYRK
jgi:uncharacterized protein